MYFLVKTVCTSLLKITILYTSYCPVTISLVVNLNIKNPTLDHSNLKLHDIVA